MELKDLFETIQLDPIHTPEFPLDIRLSKDDMFITSHMVYDNRVVRQSTNGDYIIVPIELTEQDANKFIIPTLTESAMSRNIIIYNEEDKQGRLTPRLLAIMKTAARLTRYSLSYITEFFYDRNCETPEDVRQFAQRHNINLHPCDMTEIIEYYNSTGGVYRYNHKNLVLATCKREDGNFVLPCRDDKYGVAVLDNTKVLLGMF